MRDPMAPTQKSLPHATPLSSNSPEAPSSNAYWREMESPHLTPGLQNFAIQSGLTMERGKGSRLWDVEGKEYIDFIGGIGVNSIGHGHPHYASRLIEQVQKLSIGSFTTKVRAQFIDKLASLLPAHLKRVQLYSGGTEAVEAALRLAKSYTKKWEFFSFWGAFHGKTQGTMALMGTTAKQGLGPFPPGQLSAPFADCYRCPFQTTYPSCGLACAEFTRKAIRHQSAGALAAIIVEPMQGTAGNILPPPGWLKAISEIAKENEALLICDEMITGFGRTGTWFASPEMGVEADIMTLGKGIAAGYPVSVLACREEIAHAKPFANPSGSSSSYGGYPVASAAGLATLEILQQENLVQNSAHQGAKLLETLERWKERFEFIGTVRGKGLFLALELVEDPVTKKPLHSELTLELFRIGVQEGILSMSYAPAIRLQPALSLSDEEREEGLKRLEKSFEIFESKVWRKTPFSKR